MADGSHSAAGQPVAFSAGSFALDFRGVFAVDDFDAVDLAPSDFAPSDFADDEDLDEDERDPVDFDAPDLAELEPDSLCRSTLRCSAASRSTTSA
ncbi:MAG: hypothetical protein ABWZ98_15840, partial [Nakamurella sp.]